MDLSIDEISKIINIFLVLIWPALLFVVRRWMKLEKDINAAHRRIKALEAPKCEAKSCPLTKST